MQKVIKTYTSESIKAEMIVDQSHDGFRLDQFIQFHFPSFSRELVKRKIEKKEITIEGRSPLPHRPSTKVHSHEKVTLMTYSKGSDFEKEYWKGEEVFFDHNPRIIFEDDDLLVISKPPFMNTHPTGRQLFFSATVVMASHSINNAPLNSIHRLDRETSGILLLGKNAQISARLGEAFENKTTQKCYFLISKKIYNHPQQKTAQPFYARERLSSTEGETKELYDARILITAFPENSTQGKEALTYFHPLFENEQYAIMLARPFTGRQHQIRVHAQVHGYPLLGDKLYLTDPGVFSRFKDGKNTIEDYENLEIPRHALHAIAYSIDKYSFVDDIPKDLKEWMQQKLNLTFDYLSLKKEIDFLFTVQ